MEGSGAARAGLRKGGASRLLAFGVRRPAERAAQGPAAAAELSPVARRRDRSDADAKGVVVKRVRGSQIALGVGQGEALHLGVAPHQHTLQLGHQRFA